MATEYTKVFSDSLIIVKGLQRLLDNNNILYIIRDHFESARLAGYVQEAYSVDVSILTSDLQKAIPIIDRYKAEINS